MPHLWGSLAGGNDVVGVRVAGHVEWRDTQRDKPAW